MANSTIVPVASQPTIINPTLHFTNTIITMNLPKLTHQQQAIICLLYRYRFLDRTHIQALVHHKDKRRIMAWLKDLREKQYVEWIYNKDDFAEKTKPAIYYLNLNGVLLRALGEYPVAELRKRYKDSSREQAFITRSLLIAGSCVNLEARTKSIEDVEYSYVTEADYIDPDNDYHFLEELRPQLCFVKQEGAEAEDSESESTTIYLLEVFDVTTPRYMVKKRLKDYVTYLDDDDWRADFEGDALIVLIACPTKPELIYAKRRIGLLLEDGGIELDEDVDIRFATVEQVKQQGITGMIWEEV